MPPKLKRLAKNPLLIFLYSYNIYRDKFNKIQAERAEKLRISQENTYISSAFDDLKVHDNTDLPIDYRLRERSWELLVSKALKSDKHWVQDWIDKHPASKVGTNNLSTREKWLEKTLKEIPKGKKILDAGAGELQYKRFCRHLDYTSQDFGEYTGEGDSAGLQMGGWDNSKLDIISDIASIPVKDQSFDAIMCVEVFEHIPHPLDALKEFSRILKPGGYLVITAPFSSLTHFAPYYFYNGFSRYFYEKVLAEMGFTIKNLEINGNYFEYLGQELRRLDEVAARYTPEKESNPLDKLAKHMLLKRLEKLSGIDKGSNELLLQGIQVLAVKED